MTPQVKVTNVIPAEGGNLGLGHPIIPRFIVALLLGIVYAPLNEGTTANENERPVSP